MGGTQSKKKGTRKTVPQPQKKGGTITAIDRATLDLKNSRDRLSRYRAKLDKDVEKLATRAKTLHGEGKSKQALQLMRLRKNKLQEVDRVEQQLLSVLQLVDKISEKQNEQEVIVAMKRGKDALQNMHDQMGIDDILNLMDDIRDQDDVEKQINEALGQDIVSADLDDEAVLAELNQLEEELRLESEVSSTEEEVNMPDVPSKPLPRREEKNTATTTTDAARVAVPS